MNKLDLDVYCPVDLEGEFVDYFTKLASALGMAKSLGQIFGVLFSSEDPLSLDDVAQKLGISKGSVSQGLNRLQSLGAVSPVYPARERRTYFKAEHSLRRLLALFVENTVRPRLEDNEAHLQRVEAALTDATPGYLAGRLSSLRAWNDNLRNMLPLVASLSAPPDEG